jgi:hypothetical protein
MHTASKAATSDQDRAWSEKTSRRRTMVVPITPPAVGNFRPGHTEGDLDFGSNGLFVHVVTQVQRNGNVLVLNISAYFQECESDWTTFEGSISQPFYDARVEQPGWRIQSITGETHQSIQIMVGNFGRHSFEYGSSSLIRSMVLRGDSDSGVFGGHKRPEVVAVAFNELQVELVRT